VLNRADPGISADNRDAAAAIAEFPQFRLLETSIGDRKACERNRNGAVG